MKSDIPRQKETEQNGSASIISGEASGMSTDPLKEHGITHKGVQFMKKKNFQSSTFDEAIVQEVKKDCEGNSVHTDRPRSQIVKTREKNYF